MKTTSAKEYLNSLGIYSETTSFVTVINTEPKEINLAKLMENFAELRIKEVVNQERVVVGVEPHSLTIELKNIDCNFEFLRNKIDKICPRFIRSFSMMRRKTY